MGSSCHHDHASPRTDPRVLEQSLADIEARCVADGERMTASRRRVLELLIEAGEPVKAYDLIARYGGGGGPVAKPPTVYRALEFLERRGLAHRIASISAYIACSADAGQDAHAAAFLICDCCGATQEFASGASAGLARAVAGSGYRIDRTTVEAHGRCPACLAA